MTVLGSVRIADMLLMARARGASDVHLGGPERPVMRIDGTIVPMEAPPIEEASVHAYLTLLLTPVALAAFEASGTADASTAGAAHGASGPCRIHAYRHQGGTRLAIRLLATRIPPLESLGLPDAVAGFARLGSGLVLFSGPTGSGKSTALAALLDRMNRTLARNIVTIEDPVEYLHVPARSFVTQCQLGRDVANYAEAVRGVLRADPDVILVGELRDPETMAAALAAAETGHLVLSTLHTADAAQTIDRVIDAFPPDAQAHARSQLASVLSAVVALRLVPRKAGGRCAAAEILTGTDAVRSLVREGKTHQLRNVLMTGRAAGMQTLEAHLSDLTARDEISLETARAAAARPAEIRVGTAAP